MPGASGLPSTLSVHVESAVLTAREALPEERTQLFCVLRVGDHQVGTLLAEARGCAPVVWKHELHFSVTTEQCATIQVMRKLDDCGSGCDGQLVGTCTFLLARARQASTDRMAVPIIERKTRKQLGLVSVALAFQPHTQPADAAEHLPAHQQEAVECAPDGQEEQVAGASDCGMARAGETARGGGVSGELGTAHSGGSTAPSDLSNDTNTLHVEQAAIQCGEGHEGEQQEAECFEARDWCCVLTVSPDVTVEAECTSQGSCDRGDGEEEQGGRLTLVLEGAKGLKGPPLSWLDPYCVITVGGQQLCTLPHVGGGRNPTWQQAVHFTATGAEQEAIVEIKDAWSSGAATVLGRATVPLARTLDTGSDQLAVPVLRPVSHKQRGVLTVRLAWAPRLSATSQQLPALVAITGGRGLGEEPPAPADGPDSVDAAHGVSPLCTVPEQDDMDGSTSSCSNTTAAASCKPDSMCQARGTGPLAAGAAPSAGEVADKGEAGDGGKEAAPGRFPHVKPPLSVSPSRGYIRRTMQRLRASVAGRS